MEIRDSNNNSPVFENRHKTTNKKSNAENATSDKKKGHDCTVIDKRTKDICKQSLHSMSPSKITRQRVAPASSSLPVQKIVFSDSKFHSTPGAIRFYMSSAVSSPDEGVKKKSKVSLRQ